MSKPTVDIIGNLIALLTFNEPILSCDDNVNGEFTVTVCATHGLVVGSIVEIGGISFTVKELVNNKSITFLGVSCPLETTVDIPAPNYYNGTVISTNEQVTAQTKRDADLVTPMAYFYAVFKEKRNRNPAISLGRRVEAQIFFLEDSILNADLTEDYYLKYINAMTNLVEDFVDVLEASPLIGDFEEDQYDLISHTQFAYFNKNGYEKNLFSANYSGVEFRMSIPIEKDACIDCK